MDVKNLKRTCRKALVLCALCGSTYASEPVEWTVRPGDAPKVFRRHHGASLAVRCTFAGFGDAFAPGADIRLWYQTNGMGREWWYVPAIISSNVLTAVFGPKADGGADRYALSFGAPSNAYASAVLQLMPSPGFTPNVLPPPATVDWRAELAAAISGKADATNIYTRAETDARIAELAPRADLTSATNYVDGATGAVFCAAIDAVPGIVTNETRVWTFSPDSLLIVGDQKKVYAVYSENEGLWHFYAGSGEYDLGFNVEYGETEIDGYVDTDDGSVFLTGTMTSRNALGLARLEDVPSTNGMVTAAFLTNAVRSVAYALNDYVWDGDVCWRRQMRTGGYLEYVAVTNVDLTLPENWRALEAAEAARRNGQ